MSVFCFRLERQCLNDNVRTLELNIEYKKLKKLNFEVEKLYDKKVIQ